MRVQLDGALHFQSVPHCCLLTIRTWVVRIASVKSKKKYGFHRKSRWYGYVLFLFFNFYYAINNVDFCILQAVSYASQRLLDFVLSWSTSWFVKLSTESNLWSLKAWVTPSEIVFWLCVHSAELEKLAYREKSVTHCLMLADIQFTTLPFLLFLWSSSLHNSLFCRTQRNWTECSFLLMFIHVGTIASRYFCSIEWK